MSALRLREVLLQLLAFTALASCSPRAAITPFAAPPLLPRQDLAQTCGYVEADIRKASSFHQTYSYLTSVPV